MSDVLGSEAPEYIGADISPTACRNHGWMQLDLTDTDHVDHYDLVICAGVLQYLTDEGVAVAIENLSKWAGQALYVHCPTAEDWEETADPAVSDSKIHLRSANFYRSLLADNFLAIGGGLYLPRETSVPLWSLESIHP